MAENIKIPYEGGLADAERVDVAPQDPISHEVKLADGNVLSMEINFSNFCKLTGRTDGHGEPIYIFSLQVKVTQAPKPQGGPPSAKE